MRSFPRPSPIYRRIVAVVVFRGKDKEQVLDRSVFRHVLRLYVRHVEFLAWESIMHLYRTALDGTHSISHRASKSRPKPMEDRILPS